ncbi:glyoxalase [Chloroflexota bacterium]|nr:glyoxalase [Chloroflexota bacterium]
MQGNHSEFAPAIGGWNHIGITVRNLENSLHFYQELLGFELLGRQERDSADLGLILGYERTHIRMAFLRPNGTTEPVLELIEVLVPHGEPLDVQTANPGAVHLTFDVTDLDAVSTHLTGLGVRFLSGPVTLTSGVNAGARNVYCLDPDGVRIALFQRVPGKGHHGT